MSDQSPRPAGNLAEPTAAVIADLLDVVAAHSTHDGLSELERVVAKLRLDATEVSEARDVLRSASTDVLRDALRLRAARAAPGPTVVGGAGPPATGGPAELPRIVSSEVAR